MWNQYSLGMAVVLASGVIAFAALAFERDDLHRLLLIDLVEIPSLGVVALLGTENLVVVDTKDALLVCPKDKVQQVKKLMSLLPKTVV